MIVNVVTKNITQERLSNFIIFDWHGPIYTILYPILFFLLISRDEFFKFQVSKMKSLAYPHHKNKDNKKSGNCMVIYRIFSL